MVPTPTRSFTQEAEAFRTYCQRQFKTTLDYSFDSVAILDGILGECYEGAKGMNTNESWTYLNNITLAAGAYFGEVFVRNAGATWICEGAPDQIQNWVIQVPPVNGSGPKTVAVYGAVYNFLHRGPGETLLAVTAPFLTPNGTWPRGPVAKSVKNATVRRH